MVRSIGSCGPIVHHNHPIYPTNTLSHRPAPPPPLQASDNSYHVLQYSYVSDILDKRGPYRAAHLDGAKQMASLIFNPNMPPSPLLPAHPFCPISL
jgi:hypothetical protein